MNPLTLGRLEKIDLREIWSSEAVDFTLWLARPENLEVLASALGLELEVEAQEKEVGPFRADILCKNLDSDSWVLIENQLERTDHTHLGQLLTYAAGLQAVTIIWVAARFSEEHRASLDWLNEITDERFRFFGLEVELWKIGSSPAAPKFNVVSKPNDWTRSVSKAARRISDEPVSETKALQLKYWTALKEYLSECGSKLRSQKPYPQHWTNYSIGRSGFSLCATVNTQLNRIGAELYISHDDAKQFFQLLHQQQEEIEREMGLALEWCELPEKKSSRIITFLEDADLTDEEDWQRQHSWLRDVLEKLDRAFRGQVKSLSANDLSL